MRNLFELQQYRRTDWELRAYGAMGDAGNGCFAIPYLDTELYCIASNGGGWDHVSVSTTTRIPTWMEMSFVYSQFARPKEAWMQLHVPESEHINVHPNCLHIWRPQRHGIFLPPSIMVGEKRKAVSA